MVGAGRSTIRGYPSSTCTTFVAELLGGDLGVMPIAKVASVAVDVEPAKSQWHLVIYDSCGFGPALGQAHLAQAASAHQSTPALRLACSAAQALRQITRRGDAFASLGGCALRRCAGAADAPERRVSDAGDPEENRRAGDD
jgi:hypothetical protein